MKDTNRFLLLYMDMLLKCKDNEIADFLMNTAYFSDNGKDINLHNYTIVELKKIPMYPDDIDIHVCIS